MITARALFPGINKFALVIAQNKVCPSRQQSHDYIFSSIQVNFNSVLS